MKDFPPFMKNPKNRIRQSDQHTRDIDGYVFDGIDGSQVACWTCSADRVSREHTHVYDEYVVCVFGRYEVTMKGETVILEPGGELLIPKDTPHGGACIAGTRTIHVFGGKRAERQAPPGKG